MRLLKKKWVFGLLFVAASCAGQGTTQKTADQSQTGATTAAAVPERTIEAELTDAPFVPAPIKRDYAAKVIVTLETQEVTLPIAEGVDYNFWTFGGKVPGKFIRVRKGDTVEFHLRNHPSSKFPHNIDLHAVTGPGGGAASSATAPGHESVFTFQALNPGLYVYHCATPPVGMHIANGMYGLILVEPEEGLEPVDREYYVMQGDYYTSGGYHEKGLQSFDLQKAIDEKPTYVLFNGREGALTEAGVLQAKTGEKVRLFIGNGGPNLVSSFHVIGEIFDQVFTEGGSNAQKNVQTTLVPSGGSAIIEFKTDVPGNYILVDHSIFRTFNKGSLGIMKVEGSEDKTVYSGKQSDTVYNASDLPQSQTSLEPETPSSEPSAAVPLETRMKNGQKIFSQTCFVCHQANGEGMPGAFPPLAKSDFLMADKKRSIQIVLKGLSGPVTVNEKNYNSAMPSHAQFTDAQLADVLTYVRNSWGNKGEPVTEAEVKQARSEIK